MYVAGLIIPVPEGEMEAYRRWAENSAAFFKNYGCLEVVDCWEDFVPDGQQTDFRKAVAGPPGEKIVLSWQIWPTRRASTPPRNACSRFKDLRARRTL